MRSEIRNHFKRVDPVLFRAMGSVGEIKPVTPKQPREFFEVICREIISQQLSNAAGGAILRRFEALFERKPTAKLLVEIEEKTLREVGMSWAKARYIKDLAQKLENKELNLSALPSLPDEKVITELTTIKGVGEWTAEMFCISALAREDVFSFKDVGLMRAMDRLYKIPKISREQAEPIVLKWSPYRTWASRVLWSL